ncbi:MAG: NADH-quinone oxidoreductase subunit L, partial [Actinomycetota bacterium]|nr:NADH-quinone oxidoreductase subunit L [Actinomycetota bacterium]
AILRPPQLPTALVGAARRQFGVDAALRALVQAPTLATGRGLDGTDRYVFDGAVDGMGRATVAVAASQRWVEERGVDAAVDGVAQLVGAGGRQTRRLQSGRLHEYLRDTVMGASAIGLLIALAAVL